MRVVYTLAYPRLEVLDKNYDHFMRNHFKLQKQWITMYYIASVIRKTKMKYEVQLTHIVDENALIPLDPLLIRMVNQSNCEEIKGLKI